MMFICTLYMVLTQNIIWEPHNCGIFLEKVYVRLNENGHGFSIKIVFGIILAFKSRGASYMNETRLQNTHIYSDFNNGNSFQSIKDVAPPMIGNLMHVVGDFHYSVWKESNNHKKWPKKHFDKNFPKGVCKPCIQRPSISDDGYRLYFFCFPDFELRTFRGSSTLLLTVVVSALIEHVEE